MSLSLYTIFHLNLAFSSIEEELRPEVVRRCYWPLLRLARDLNLPFGIEITGYTLETVAAIDPAWVEELRELCSGQCELVGSGYSQMIGPLVPAEVNRQNLRIGNQTYERLLGLRPRIVLVNEQAYSAGLIGHYREAGFEAMVMEWDNPAYHHPQWDPAWRYLPQIAMGQHGEELPVIWNNSIFFQKFQRYVHGELELDDYLALIGRHDNGTTRAIPLYGNDIEIFDFRPGRFTTEAVMEHDEWGRIRELFERLLEEGRFTFIPPSRLLSLLHEPGAGNRLSLESPEAPIPVKKQEKYNITRWAVTGRDDIGINSACQRIHDALLAKGNATDQEWRELCYLWSSDFRTHITPRRWKRYRSRLNSFGRHCGITHLTRLVEGGVEILPPEVSALREGHYLTIETPGVRLKLNLRRGLAFDSLVFSRIHERSLCGTLYHGYFDDITAGADFYTGHAVFETHGRPKITDLAPVEPLVRWHPEGGMVTVEATFSPPLGPITKLVGIDINTTTISIDYRFDWPLIPVGSLRLGNVTINPEAFDAATLFFRAHNGGNNPETFPVAGKRFFHGEASSFLVSAKQGLGVTEGIIEIGDAHSILQISVDRSLSALLGLVTCKPVGPSYFFRCGFSASEMDETSKPRRNRIPLRAHISISAASAKSAKQRK
ncbi:hypothetical protein Gmet_0448 [Geobacter metallireducens GS-15]|uniref:Glycoside hydrolase family 57 N-terminal domain-containing protein n=1 Tax=Geobacter metallireducens (strain ATCC 53774 / DSM 7210 / GS-15) TaxID=269799 RepID=Q39YI3_GEOMG|nr:glycoside hydrolase family 57 [Geobacter metallireducens]ABB30691.1 hypothetical protein Gmet_0448 [Geobacter metallireducens GS-15]